MRNRHNKEFDIIEHIEEETPVVKNVIVLRALAPYHNAAIVGKVGVHWRIGEEREVSWPQFEQIMSDSGKFERVR